MGSGGWDGLVSSWSPARVWRGVLVVSPLGSRIWDSDSGATAVEYAIMVSLIAMAIFGTVLLLGLSLPPVFDRVVAGLTS